MFEETEDLESILLQEKEPSKDFLKALSKIDEEQNDIDLKINVNNSLKENEIKSIVNQIDE